MRLIDADALCMHLSDWQFGSMTDGKHDAEYEVINKVIDGIEKEPTVDAVAVVLCKDCKWQSTVHDADDNSNYYMCGVHAQPTDPYAFCSYGERRSE